jgi:hypothetical protein
MYKIMNVLHDFSYPVFIKRKMHRNIENLYFYYCFRPGMLLAFYSTSGILFVYVEGGGVNSSSRYIQ